MKPNPFGLGAHPSPTDHRDFRDPDLALASPYPDKFVTDISSLEVRMQFQIGKCIGEAVAKKTDSLIPVNDFSDDFLYRGTKQFIDQNTNEGTSFRSALKFAQQYGICRKQTFQIPVTQDMTYDQYMSFEVTQAAWAEASQYKIGQYLSVPIDVSLIKAAIYKYGILVARVDVGQEWWTNLAGVDSWNPADIFPLRSPKQVVSGHGIVIYGYDSTITPGKTLLYISNSWSSAWGDQGNGNLYFEDYYPHLTEAWAVTTNPVTPGTSADVSIPVTGTVLSTFLNLLRKIGVLT